MAFYTANLGVRQEYDLYSLSLATAKLLWLTIDTKLRDWKLEKSTNT